MKKIIASLGIVLAIIGTFSRKHHTVIYAQTLPYLATYTWTAPADGSAVSYNCYLDSVLVVNVTATTCQVSIPTLGAHTAGVTSVNPADVPSESVPLTLAFTLKQPSPSTGIKVK